jgi:hypothetical protein
MSQSLPPRRLTVEQLEDRLTPAFGTPWIDGTHLTLSFAPDGTNITGVTSNLFATMNATTPQAQWETAILRAYQTWVAAANLNVGLVGDTGAPLGTPGAPQGDPRFGDIRIAARPLSAPGTPGSTEADTAGFDYSDRTWSGDSVYNSLYQFGIGGSGQQSDIYSVALHEAGHSFGLADQSTDPTSVMYAGYQGVLTGLSASDVAAIQSLYGARPVDPYGTASGNGTLATAYNLGTTTTLSADLSQIGDADMFALSTPAASNKATGLTINLQAAGISLVTTQVTILDAHGNVVASTATTDPLHNNLSLTVPNYQPGATYYVKVQGSTGDVFSVGSYVLNLNYTGGYHGRSVNNYTRNYGFNAGSTSNNGLVVNNNSIATALNLAPVTVARANSFNVLDGIATGSSTNWYQITPTLPGAAGGTLFVGSVLTLGSLQPTISVYDVNGNLLSTVVTMNQGGSYEVELANASSGTTYYISVGSQDGQSVGFYTLSATLAPVAATQFISAGNASLTTAGAINDTQMTVTGDRLVQFALSATGGSFTGVTGVRMSIFDATGKLVFTMSAVAGAPLSTGFVWLGSGSYTVVYNAATSDGSDMGLLSVSVASRTLTDPIDPLPINPTSPPPPPQSPITVPTPPPVPPAPPLLPPVPPPSL